MIKKSVNMEHQNIYESVNIKIWNVIKRLLMLKFTVSPVPDDKYIYIS